MKLGVWMMVIVGVVFPLRGFGGQGSVAIRQEMFVGLGTASWIPASPLLPAGKQLDEMAKKLGSRQRSQDVFGLHVFPVEEGRIPVGVIPRATETVTLSQALQTLRVTGVNLVKKEFLMGSRNVFQGDVLELSYKGEVFFAEVLEVGAAQIVFRDRHRGETGILGHGLVRAVTLEPLQKRSREPRVDAKVTRMEPVR